MTPLAHLTRIRPERNEWRFYRIDIWPDLFGGVSLVRQWGRIGQHGQCRRAPYSSEADVAKAAQALSPHYTISGGTVPATTDCRKPVCN